MRYGVVLSPILLSVLIAGSSAVSAGDLWIDSRCRPLPTRQLGPFVRLEDGRILAIDRDSSYVSQDNGRTWSAARPLFGKTESIQTPNIQVSNERALLRTKSGTVIAAFMNLSERKWTWKNELGDAPGAKLPTYVMRSLDGGKSWQDVQKLHDDWSGAVRDMIETAGGRIIFTAMKMRHDPGRHAVLTYSSTDDGKTWKASNLIDLGGAGHHGGVTEPTLTELADGRFWMLIRTNWSEFWSAYSYDGGRYWRVIKPSGIKASSAPAMLRRLASGRLMLLWNRPDPSDHSQWPLSGGDNLWSATPVSNFREELSVAFSEDDGKSWSRPTVLAHSRSSSAKGSRRWIAYPYVFEKEPGVIWVTTMQGGLRIEFHERDFVEPGDGGEPRTKTVVAFGDSTTAPRGKLRVYTAILREELSRRDAPWKVINAGVGGNTTADGLARFEQDVLSQRPDTVIMQFGINDASVDVWKSPPATRCRVRLDHYVDNLRELIKRSRTHGIRPILMTPNPLRWTKRMRELYGNPPYDVKDERGLSILVDIYAQRVRELAREEHVELIDVHAEFDRFSTAANRSMDELLLDGVHPSALGHQLVADLIVRHFAPAGKSDKK